MPSARLLSSLAADAERLRAVAARDLTARVPTCPDWVVDDLVRHVANGLRNVALRRVLGQDPIIEQSITDADPIAAVERAHTDFVAELQTRPLDELAEQPPPNDYTSAETAYFWLRRMTHEIAVHRADAELALGDAVTPVPHDLAVDGVAEMLELFLRYGSRDSHEKFVELLNDWGDERLLVRAGEGSWLISVTPAGVNVAAGDGRAAATLHAEPTTMLMWLYNRGDGVTSEGDPQLIARMRGLLDRSMFMN